MLNLDEVLKPAPGVVTRESDAELVVVLPDTGRYFVLNGTGAEIYALLDGQRSLEEIVALLNTRYPDVAPKRLRQDVLHLAAQLVEREAVRTL
jgi:hypothetical protein